MPRNPCIQAEFVASATLEPSRQKAAICGLVPSIWAQIAVCAQWVGRGQRIAAEPLRLWTPACCAKHLGVTEQFIEKDYYVR